MANIIVEANVSLQVAPTPNNQMQQGAFISQGGTTLASGTFSLLTSSASLAPLLTSPLAITSLAWAGGTVTATTATPHGITTGDIFLTAIAGATPSNYNGTYRATITGASTFTYALASDGGTTPATGSITYTGRNSAELVAMNNTFWAQGNNTPVYVLELGTGEPAAGVTALTTFITNNPGMFYAYRTPRSWDSVSSFLALAVQLSGTAGTVYFYQTISSANIANYTNQMKSIRWLVDAPGIPTTEDDGTAPFWNLLSTQPSNATPVAPFQYRFEFGVTPWPTANNGPLLASFLSGGGNYMGSGSQGGISNVILQGGQGSDGLPINFWYATDFAQINGAQFIANAVINGSQPGPNPLYFDQPGINRLQQAFCTFMTSMVTFGLCLNPPKQTELDATAFQAALDAGAFDNVTVVNAVPFPAYTAANPGDYKIGQYTGLTSVFTPKRGFDRIVFNLVVSQFA